MVMGADLHQLDGTRLGRSMFRDVGIIINEVLHLNDPPTNTMHLHCLCLGLTLKESPWHNGQARFNARQLIYDIHEIVHSSAQFGTFLTRFMRR